LLAQIRALLRTKHYALRTEQAYIHWVKRFIFFHGKRHPKDMGAPEIESFLSHLATERTVAASTQNQALAALLFLYRDVLDVDLPWLDNITRAKPSKHLPTVLTQAEAASLIRHLKPDTNGLIVQLLYGTGMRLLECLRLRVKDQAAKDALNGVAWLDDCQVKRVIVDKRFSDQPRVEIFIRKTGQASSQVTRKDQIRSAS
jgi:integrase